MTIFVLGFVYSLPRFFEYRTEVQIEKLTIGENLTENFEHLVITNQVLDNRIYHYIVHLGKTKRSRGCCRSVSIDLLVLYSLFQSILPLLMLSYFNVELIRSIHASSDFLKHFTSLNGQNVRRGNAKSSSRYREGSVTRSVICLIGLFTLCQVPASILHYIYMFYRNHPVLYICYDISNFLILVNSAVREREKSMLPHAFFSHRWTSLFSPTTIESFAVNWRVSVSTRNPTKPWLYPPRAVHRFEAIPICERYSRRRSVCNNCM